MSCGELFVNLGGGGSTPPDGMLQTTAALSSSLQVVKDNLGNSSVLSLATTTTKIASTTGNGWLFASAFSGSYTALYPSNIGTPNNTNYVMLLDSGGATYLNAANELYLGTNNSQIVRINSLGINVNNPTNNGILSIKGSGGNILSLRNSSNVERFSIGSGGELSSTTYGIFGGSTVIGNGSIIYEGSSTNGFLGYTSANNWHLGLVYFLSLGGTTSSFPALKRSSAILQTKLADDSAFAVHEVLSILTQKPTNSNAQKIKFGDKSPITDGALVALGFDAQWEVEINGSSYWFAGKTSAFA